MVEHEGGGQGQSGGGVELVAQLDGAEGVESEVAEGAVGADLVGAGVSEDFGRAFAHQGQHGRGAATLREPGEALAQAGPDCRASRPPSEAARAAWEGISASRRLGRTLVKARANRSGSTSATTATGRCR